MHWEDSVGASSSRYDLLQVNDTGGLLTGSKIAPDEMMITFGLTYVYMYALRGKVTISSVPGGFQEIQSILMLLFDLCKFIREA